VTFSLLDAINILGHEIGSASLTAATRQGTAMECGGLFSISFQDFGPSGLKSTLVKQFQPNSDEQLDPGPSITL
jgi:hypothetical protein